MKATVAILVYTETIENEKTKKKRYTRYKESEKEKERNEGVEVEVINVFSCLLTLNKPFFGILSVRRRKRVEEKEK